MAEIKPPTDAEIAAAVNQLTHFLEQLKSLSPKEQVAGLSAALTAASMLACYQSLQIK